MTESKPFSVERPWGQFRQFAHNEFSTVKIISVNPHSSLSLQYHNHRSEFWRVISGHPIITIGKKEIEASPGDEFTIKEKELHRLSAKNDAVQVLEIAYGDFDEDDIIRVEDKYGRA